MRHVLWLLFGVVLAGCGEAPVDGFGCDPFAPGELVFEELEGDCGAFPALEGDLDAPRIDVDPRGYRCAWRPERMPTCGLAFELTCEAMPPVGEVELVGHVEPREFGAVTGEAELVRYALEGNGPQCSSRYAVRAR